LMDSEMTILLGICLVLISPLVVLVVMYILASLIVFSLFQVPLTRKYILNRFDENLNHKYDEFVKKRYTRKDCNRQSYISHYVKEIVKCYLNITWRGMKYLSTQKRNIKSINHLNDKRNRKDECGSSNSIPNLINEGLENKPSDLPQLLHIVKRIIKKAKSWCQLKKNDTTKEQIIQLPRFSPHYPLRQSERGQLSPPLPRILYIQVF